MPTELDLSQVQAGAGYPVGSNGRTQPDVSRIFDGTWQWWGDAGAGGYDPPPMIRRWNGSTFDVAPYTDTGEAYAAGNLLLKVVSHSPMTFQVAYLDANGAPQLGPATPLSTLATTQQNWILDPYAGELVIFDYPTDAADPNAPTFVRWRMNADGTMTSAGSGAAVSNAESGFNVAAFPHVFTWGQDNSGNVSIAYDVARGVALDAQSSQRIADAWRPTDARGPFGLTDGPSNVAALLNDDHFERYSYDGATVNLAVSTAAPSMSTLEGVALLTTAVTSGDVARSAWWYDQLDGGLAWWYSSDLDAYWPDKLEGGSSFARVLHVVDGRSYLWYGIGGAPNDVYAAGGGALVAGPVAARTRFY